MAATYEGVAMSARAVRLSSPTTIHKPNQYSHVAEVSGGRIVYIAGQVAHDVSGALVGKDDFAAQVRQIFENLKAAVESAGGTTRDIVKLAFFCCDRVPATQLPAVREIRNQYIDVQNPPVSTFVFVSRLVQPDWLIEVEAVAVVDG
jgi:enamine deaminase RidA (YjgF/YER057c/UK114 family)